MQSQHVRVNLVQSPHAIETFASLIAEIDTVVSTAASAGHLELTYFVTQEVAVIAVNRQARGYHDTLNFVVYPESWGSYLLALRAEGGVYLSPER